MKKIEDYLHFYLGQQFRQRYIDYEPGQWTVWVTLTAERLFRLLNDHSINGIQLALRPLLSITEQECIEIGMYKQKKEWHDLEWNKAKMQLRAAVNDKKEIEFTCNEFRQLLSKGFDLFGLIEDGIAVVADTGLKAGSIA